MWLEMLEFLCVFCLILGVPSGLIKACRGQLVRFEHFAFVALFATLYLWLKTGL